MIYGLKDKGRHPCRPLYLFLHTHTHTETQTLLGEPEGTRTPNLLIRSQVLYPIKLQVRN